MALWFYEVILLYSTTDVVSVGIPVYGSLHN